MRRPYRWIEPLPVDSGLQQSIAGQLGISSVLAGILIRRGYRNVDGVERFINPRSDLLNDPFLMKDMDAAAARVVEAVERRERVFIHGDYDVDGLTATAVLERVLGNLGLTVTHYVPNRLSEGYGVSREGILLAVKEEADLIITVDCGIVACEEIEFASAQDLDVIVTDHHEPGTKLPEAVAVLDPKRPDCSYPDEELAGIGVAFKLCQAVYRELGRDDRELDRYLDLVALGTIADVSPLIGENRIFVHRGLEVMRDRPNPAIGALLKAAGLSGKNLSANHIAFNLAPRINAVGRMGDSQKVVTFLTTESPDEAFVMADYLEQENRKRQKIDSRVLVEAKNMLTDFDPERDWAIVLSSETWHPGVLGIVASRIVEHFYRPAVLIRIDEDGVGRGSARSIPSFHLYDALRSCRDLLIEYGGHQYAAGIRIRKENVEALRECLNRQARATLTPESLMKELRIDAEITFDDIGWDLVRDLKLTAPNGPANPKPLFLMRGIFVDGYPRVVGEDHLRMRVKQGERYIDAIGFSFGGLVETLSTTPGTIDMVFTLEENTWQGSTNLQARIRDIRFQDDDPDRRRTL